VLQNMTVLSAGTTTQPDARGQAIQAPSVTLLATPEQAETLTLAGQNSRIQLVLRNSSDQEIAKTGGKQLSELYGAPRRPVPSETPAPRPAPKAVVAQTAPAPPVAAPPPPPPPPDQIVMIRGTQRTVETIPNRPAPVQ
jgi:pilus assembly protein CpaB